MEELERTAVELDQEPGDPSLKPGRTRPLDVISFRHQSPIRTGSISSLEPSVMPRMGIMWLVAGSLPTWLARCLKRSMHELPR